jgi:hypothetical protein
MLDLRPCRTTKTRLPSQSWRPAECSLLGAGIERPAWERPQGRCRVWFNVKGLSLFLCVSQKKENRFKYPACISHGDLCRLVPATGIIVAPVMFTSSPSCTILSNSVWCVWHERCLASRVIEISGRQSCRGATRVEYVRYDNLTIARRCQETPLHPHLHAFSQVPALVASRWT